MIDADKPILTFLWRMS